MKILKTLFMSALLIALIRPVHADHMDSRNASMSDDFMFDDVSFEYNAHLSKDVERLNGDVMTYEMDSRSGSFTGLFMDFDMFMSFGIETYAEDVVVNFEDDELELQHVEVTMIHDDQILFQKTLRPTEEFQMNDSLKLDEAEYEFRFKYSFKEVKHHYFLDVFMDNRVSQADVRLFDDTLSVDERVFTVSQEVLLDHLLTFDANLKIESIYLHNVIDESGIHHKRMYRLSELPQEIQFVEYVSKRSDERWSKPRIHVQFTNDEYELIKPSDEKGLYSFDFLDDWPYPKEVVSDVVEFSPLKAGFDVNEIRFIAPAINVDQKTTPISTMNHRVSDGLHKFWIEVQQFAPIKLEATEGIEERLLKTVVGRNAWYDYLEPEELQRLGAATFKDNYAYDDIYSYQLVYDETVHKTYIYSNAMEEGYRLGLYGTLDGDYVSTQRDIPKGIIPDYGVEVDDHEDPQDLDDQENTNDLIVDSNKQDPEYSASNTTTQTTPVDYVDVKTGVSYSNTYAIGFVGLLSSLLAWLLKKY